MNVIEREEDEEDAEEEERKKKKKKKGFATERIASRRTVLLFRYRSLITRNHNSIQFLGMDMTLPFVPYTKKKVHST